MNVANVMVVVLLMVHVIVMVMFKIAQETVVVQQWLMSVVNVMVMALKKILIVMAIVL